MKRQGVQLKESRARRTKWREDQEKQAQDELLNEPNCWDAASVRRGKRPASPDTAAISEESRI